MKTAIYLIASSLLYPVLALLLAAAVWIVLQAGAFFAEWVLRQRLARVAPEELPQRIRSEDLAGILPPRTLGYIARLRGPSAMGAAGEAAVENLLQSATLAVWTSLDGLKLLIRVAPGLGLIGTLIPMGTGLAALGQGDMTKLSSDLVIAFTTTVVGLAVGMCAYFFYTLKRRWAEEDVKNMELATEILINDE